MSVKHGSVQRGRLGPRELGERLLTGGDETQGLGFAGPGEETAHRRARREPERRHHVFSPEKRRHRGQRLLLGGARHQGAEHPSAPVAPEVERGIAAEGGGVDEGEEQQVRPLGVEVTEEAMARAARDLAGLGQMHGSQVMADQALDHRGGTAREPQALRHRECTRGADDVVADESHASVRLGSRLGLGHVVEQRGELEGGPPGEPVAEVLGQVRDGSGAKSAAGAASTASAPSTVRSECSQTSK